MSLPEKRLLLAMLERAGMDLLKGGVEARAARSWIFDWSREDYGSRFTFPWCCLNLDLCPTSTAARIERLEAEVVASGLVFKPRPSANIADWILSTESELPISLLIDP